MPTATDKLIARKEGAIGWVIFNNPAKRNALSLDMYEATAAALEDYTKDPAIRVVILRGEGDKAFISGADISQFKDKRSSMEQVRAADAISERCNKALRECPKPTIAMILGYCMGGGISIAVVCDLRIASEDSRFGVPAAKLGVGYRHAGVKRLMDLVGPSFTAEIFYTGRQFSAQEALQMGLVNRVLPAAELEKYVMDYAATLAGNAPLTIAAVKRSLIELRKDPAERDLALCQKLVDDCFASEDYKEGQAAFMEKRKPAFKGR
ncbi:MAG: enoyl-CoA hydratase/isomerase family protein [Betaproteobacteria bacterium]|nr:enoyl-CoA hydratase/isomerase family protein [Betaproteobacteria bacterium]